MIPDVDIIDLAGIPDDIRGDACAFIVDTWVKSFYHFRASLLDRRAYKVGQRNLAMRLMSEAETQLVTLPDDLGLFVGWVCREGDRLHYVYVRHAHRRQGLASRLTAGVQVATHRPTTPVVQAWAERCGIGYDPYLLMR